MSLHPGEGTPREIRWQIQCTVRPSLYPEAFPGEPDPLEGKIVTGGIVDAEKAIRLSRWRDPDDDNIFDPSDNCPCDANVNQLDYDLDRVGNACDNCTWISNFYQEDDNGNGVGDICECDRTDPDACDDGDPATTDVCLPVGYDPILGQCRNYIP